MLAGTAGLAGRAAQSMTHQNTHIVALFAGRSADSQDLQARYQGGDSHVMLRFGGNEL